MAVKAGWPDNCRWMDRAEQGRNMRNNQALTKWESLWATVRKTPAGIGLEALSEFTRPRRPSSLNGQRRGVLFPRPGPEVLSA